MATYKPLSTDFKDDILASQNSKRKYTQVNNPDGTVSFQDSTAYSQVGSSYGAKEVNEEREAINNIYANKLVTLDEIDLVTEPGFFVDAQVVKELNSNIKILNSKKDSGHALKVFNASENLVYGCWDDGLYRYPGYYSGNGAPSDWAGIMLVSPIFVNGEINGFLKVAWDMSMTQYIMKNNKDGSVSQAWTKM